MTSEQQAIAVGASRVLLRKELYAVRRCLTREYQAIFRGATFDFHAKRLTSPCRRYALIWRVRNRPDLPVSYENQQTNRGTVGCFNLRVTA